MNKWKITHNKGIGYEFWQIYRLIDPNGVDHSGNREYATEDVYSNREDAQVVCDRFNQEMQNA